MNELDQALSQVRLRQKKQIAEYEQQSYVGKMLEIPWTDHLPVRFILNMPKEKPAGKMKVFVNLHGGGFIEGDARQMGSYCQKLADGLKILVVNINYRLSPDYLYPYQCEEVELVYDYLCAHADEMGIDMAHCGIGGFSAGATLSLNVLVRALEAGESRYSCCVLGYPMVTVAADENDAQSEFQAADALMMRMIGQYFNGQGELPACSALNADEALLRRFPAVIELTCGKDSLGMQGRKFAAKLAMAGVRMNYAEYREAKHGFIEVNRPDYLPADPRKSADQAKLCTDAEAFIMDGLTAML